MPWLMIPCRDRSLYRKPVLRAVTRTRTTLVTTDHAASGPWLWDFHFGMSARSYPMKRITTPCSDPPCAPLHSWIVDACARIEATALPQTRASSLRRCAVQITAALELRTADAFESAVGLNLENIRRKGAGCCREPGGACPFASICWCMLQCI